MLPQRFYGENLLNGKRGGKGKQNQSGGLSDHDNFLVGLGVSDFSKPRNIKSETQ